MNVAVTSAQIAGVGALLLIALAWVLIGRRTALAMFNLSLFKLFMDSAVAGFKALAGVDLSVLSSVMTAAFATSVVIHEYRRGTAGLLIVLALTGLLVATSLGDVGELIVAVGVAIGVALVQFLQQVAGAFGVTLGWIGAALAYYMGAPLLLRAAVMAREGAWEKGVLVSVLGIAISTIAVVATVQLLLGAFGVVGAFGVFAPLILLIVVGSGIAELRRELMRPDAFGTVTIGSAAIFTIVAKQLSGATLIGDVFNALAQAGGLMLALVLIVAAIMTVFGAWTRSTKLYTTGMLMLSQYVILAYLGLG